MPVGFDDWLEEAPFVGLNHLGDFGDWLEEAPVVEISEPVGYLERPVFDLPRPTFENLKHGQLDDFTYESEGGGLATPWKPTSKPKRTLKYKYILEGRDQIKLFRSFVSQMLGRLRGFWIPIYFNDYWLTADAVIGGDTITIQKIGLEDKWTFGTQFQHLVLFTRDNMEFYGIKSVSVLGDIETVILDADLRSTFPANVTVCAGLIYGRFSDTEISYQFLTDDTALVECGFTELPTETITPDFGSGHVGMVHLGHRPMYLYELELNGTIYRYANWGIDVVIGSFTWAAASITHSAISRSIDFISEEVSLKISTDDDAHPLRNYIGQNLLEPINVTIHASDFDSFTYAPLTPLYEGRVNNINFQEEGRIDVQVSSILRISEMNIPKMGMQRTCNNRLYDVNCQVVEATFTTAGTLITVTDDYIEATAFGAKATAEGDPNWFALGRVKIGDEWRTCVGQDANKLYINFPFRKAIVGNIANARAGCDKRIVTCDDKFDNLDNFQGYRYMPNRNPQMEVLSRPKGGGGKKT